MSVDMVMTPTPMVIAMRPMGNPNVQVIRVFKVAMSVGVMVFRMRVEGVQGFGHVAFWDIERTWECLLMSKMRIMMD